MALDDDGRIFNENAIRKSLIGLQNSNLDSE
jgi:hypothetical protein